VAISRCTRSPCVALANTRSSPCPRVQGRCANSTYAPLFPAAERGGPVIAARRRPPGWAHPVCARFGLNEITVRTRIQARLQGSVGTRAVASRRGGGPPFGAEVFLAGPLSASTAAARARRRTRSATTTMGISDPGGRLVRVCYLRSPYLRHANRYRPRRPSGTETRLGLRFGSQSSVCKRGEPGRQRVRGQPRRTPLPC